MMALGLMSPLPRYKKNYCPKNFKAAGGNNDGAGANVPPPFFFSSSFPRIFQGDAFYMCRQNYSHYKRLSRHSHYGECREKLVKVMAILILANLRLCGMPF